jgi:hypothetical protein
MDKAITGQEKKIWLKNLIYCFQEISFKDEQVDLWLMGTKYISSPTECYCQLYDDNRFEEFIVVASAEFGFTEEERIELIEFERAMHAYDIDDKAPEEIIEDPQWHAIGKKARPILSHLIEKLAEL